MKNYLNERSLLCRKRADIDDFIKENPAWEEIYNLFLKIRDIKRKVNIPAVEMLNEVCYQCTRAAMTKHPEGDIWEGYTYPGEYEATSRPTLICLSLVYVALRLSDLPHRQMKRYLTMFDKRFSDDPKFKPYYKSLMTSLFYLVEKNMDYWNGFFCDSLEETEDDFRPCPELNFSPRPEPPEYIRLSADEWAGVTEGFDPQIIRSILTLWPTDTERLEVVRLIERSFNEVEQNRADNDNCVGQRGIGYMPSPWRVIPGFFQTLRTELAGGKQYVLNQQNELEVLRKENRYYRDELEKQEQAQHSLRKELEAYKRMDGVKEQMEQYESLQNELAEEKRLHAEARQKTKQLKRELEQLTDKLKLAEKDGERLPLTAFLDYVENYFTPQQNDRAKVMKEVLGDLYSQEYMTDEEKERFRKLGTKPVPVSTMTVNGPLNDIHDNGHVRAGM